VALLLLDKRPQSSSLIAGCRSGGNPISLSLSLLCFCLQLYLYNSLYVFSCWMDVALPSKYDKTTAVC
jgi:hypothetical protein